MLPRKAVKIICIILAVLMALSAVAALTAVFAVDEGQIYALAPSTGDSGNPILFSVIIVVALFAVIMCLVAPKLKKKDDSNDKTTDK